ncbi:MAG: 16S rRNA (cytidine(1402)-2'-O)-methyltransferase [Oscillospiraceae bacterium]|nr:16S rRNA (cytidine(1402)-2'-O)-methyltransferase [Oscillospiraceae bacterium]
MPGKLTLVGTPIGNLGDMSPRGLEALRGCDFIAAEDTRVTRKLLTHFGISRPLISYHEHNQRDQGERILARLLDGQTVALVTDAGMPAVSDPGEALVALCHQHGVPVEVVPGPAAVTAAVALSGLPSGRFTFEGFLTTNKRGRREHLASLAREERTMVFYEAPHKLIYTLKDLLEALGDRRVTIAREITKIYEEVLPTTLAQAVAHYQNIPPKGEFVLVIEGKNPRETAKEDTVTPEEAAQRAKELMAEGLSASEAARRTAAETGCKKGDIYKCIMHDEAGN